MNTGFLKLFRTGLILTVLGVGLLYPFANTQNSQAQQNPNREKVNEQTTDEQSKDMPPKTKVPLGTKRGLDELKAVLDASEPTNAPPIRKVIISVPNELPEYVRLREAGATAVREFFLIADIGSLNLDNFDPTSAPDPASPEGQRANLPNGGTIRLKTRKIKDNNNKSRSVGELQVKGHGIPGYEEVNQIEFFVQ